jgi:hypothetical protein
MHSHEYSRLISIIQAYKLGLSKYAYIVEAYQLVSFHTQNDGSLIFLLCGRIAFAERIAQG